MRLFIFRLYRNLLNSFKGKNFLYHVLAIVLTYILVISGFDWKYFQFFHSSRLATVMFSAAAIGGLFPILVPAVLLLFGKIRKNPEFFNVSYALMQAVILGSFISSLYKAFTGRAHPNLYGPGLVDMTHAFQFGFLRGGIFWGWPSSHTMIAFAMAFTLWTMYPKSKAVRAFSLVYALYIGLGVSMTIHWFSDFAAGAIIGAVIGIVVGKSFMRKVSPIELSGQ